VADQYNHKSKVEPDRKAGAKDRAGFMEATEINDKKKISNPTIAPIAIPLKPFSPFGYTTTRMTTIKRAEAAISTPKITNTGKS
jgi:hypothetical protein